MKLPAVISCLLMSAAVLVGCQSISPLDTKPLDEAGMSYDAMRRLEAIKIQQTEILEVAKVRQAGIRDAECVRLVGIYHARKTPFEDGDAVAGLLEVGMSEPDVMELAELNQLGVGVGELQAMKLAGLSELIVMDVARAHAQGKPVLSGASLGRMKNAAIRGTTLLQLVKRGVPDSEADAILSARKHGMSDAEILRHFHGSA
jgi:hypothetical protein